MQSGKTGLVASAILLSLAHCAKAQFSYAEVSNQAVLQHGEGTYYGAGQDSQGTCSFSANFANTNKLPWSTGAALTLALNDAQFDNSNACGLCVMFRGTGAGLGTQPIPSTWTLGFVNNRCPECAKGDLDLSTSGDGRWKIEWYAVPCNVGSSTLVYSIVVSSYYWFSLVVSNTRYPITSVSIKLGGQSVPLKRTNNNQWAYYNSNGPWQSAFPLPVTITDCLGETVEDVITTTTGNTGKVQFGASGGGGGAPAGNATANTVAAATPPALPGSLTQAPPAQPPAAPPVVPATPPAAPPAPSRPLTDGGFYIEDNQQCGGNGKNCNNNPYTAAPCQDIAWPKAVCRSQANACQRNDASLWLCIPGTAPTPPAANATNTTSPPAPLPVAQAAVNGTPPAQAATPPSPPAAANDTQGQGAQFAQLRTAGTSPPPPGPSGTQPPPPGPSGSPPPPPGPSGSPPPPGQVAAASTQSSAASPPPPATTSSFVVSNGAQCGGTTQCSPAGTATDKVTCNNGPWAGASCNQGYSCLQNPGPLIWSCLPASVATGGRRLLSS